MTADCGRIGKSSNRSLIASIHHLQFITQPSHQQYPFVCPKRAVQPCAGMDWVQPVPTPLPVWLDPEHGHHRCCLPGEPAYAAAHWQHCGHAERVRGAEPRPGQGHQQSHQRRSGAAPSSFASSQSLLTDHLAWIVVAK